MHSDEFFILACTARRIKILITFGQKGFYYTNGRHGIDLTFLRDANLKKSKSGRSPILPFLTLKKLLQVEICQLNLKKIHQISNFFPQNAKNQPKYA